MPIYLPWPVCGTQPQQIAPQPTRTPLTRASEDLPVISLDTTDELFGAIPAGYVAVALGVRQRTLTDWRRRGFGPPSMRLGRFLTLYPAEGLLQWWASPAASRTRRRVQSHQRHERRPPPAQPHGTAT